MKKSADQQAVELASAIGVKALGLRRLGDSKADSAFAFLVTANRELFVWLRDRLNAVTE